VFALSAVGYKIGQKVSYKHGIRALQFVAAGLAGATMALAYIHYDNGQRAPAPAFEPSRNVTVAYRQGALVKSPARLSDPVVVQNAHAHEEHSIGWRYPRAVQTISFVNPAGASHAVAAAAEPMRAVSESPVMTKVGGFIAFPSKDAATPDDSTLRFAAPRKGLAVVMEEVDHYLWEVYQRSPIKKDNAGDFTWKDPAAAKRVNMTLPDYVIGGMDPDFREMLYHAGKAMDAAGIKWTILSGFRDDYRQGIAAGFKARTGNSLHGGSRATGGYGNGRAADVVAAEGGNSEDLWDWLDDHGAKYGIARPMPDNDPAHIQARGDRHKVASTLRSARVKDTDLEKIKVASAEKPKVGGTEKAKGGDKKVVAEVKSRR
jgi:hypothetical protein